MHTPVLDSCGHELFRLALAIFALDSFLSCHCLVVTSNLTVFQAVSSSYQYMYACPYHSRNCPALLQFTARTYIDHSPSPP